MEEIKFLLIICYMIGLLCVGYVSAENVDGPFKEYPLLFAIGIFLSLGSILVLLAI